MTATFALRTAIVFEWLFGLSTIILSITLERFLPDPLREYLAVEAESVPSLAEFLILPLAIVMLLVLIASSIGLLLLQRWARWGYLASMALSCVLMPFLGPHVEHALTEAFDMASMILSGVVIGLAFFTNAIPERKHASPPMLNT
jgi:hypothetical protein